MKDEAYVLTSKRSNAVDVYSVRSGDEPPNVLIFQEREDAERYVIMLTEDVDYIVGEGLELEITEIPLGNAIDIFNEKGHNYIFVKSDDLFVPPDADFFPPPAADY